ncbi:hypothetical protein G6F68_013462 [Rhizopus microsporus]|nr:hypothetical protein G6F68_013462 [Rhizopus microsporus]
MVVLDQRDLRAAGLIDHADQLLVVGAPHQLRDFGDRVLEQSLELAGGRIQRTHGGRCLAIILLSVDRAVRGGAQHAQVLAIGLGCVDQRPVAAIAPIEFASFIVFAAIVAAGTAHGETRLLAGIQCDIAVLLGRACQRGTPAADGVHADHLGPRALGRARYDSLPTLLLRWVASRVP